MISALRSLFRHFLYASLALGAFGTGAEVAGQQQAQQIIRQQTGQEVSQAQILQRLRESGMTRVEVQQRLRELGYDASLADPYFDRLEGVETGGVPEPSADFLQALNQLGMLSPGIPEGMELQGIPDAPVEEEALDQADSLESWVPGVPIFGRAIFSGPSSQFQTITTGPVDSDYRLGPGDQLILVITGDVELAYTLEVNREGLVVVPDVGQVFVNGRTLAELEDHLFDRLGSVYSGVQRGAGASTFFHVSIGRLRTNLVYVIGEASTPGAYQVSSVATLFNALYGAGGPSAGGSFRSIQVRRDDRVIAEVDLYGYLLGGDASQDLRLEQGDIIFIPLSGPQVAIRGRVRRSAVFELKAQDDLLELLRFAGGPLPDAYLERIQIDRILSPDQRLPGFERVLVDVDGNRVLSGEFRFEPRDGDIVEVFGISSQRYNRVTIRGDVTYPGTYEYRAGMTLWSLIDRAGGLLPDAFEHRAHIRRPIVEDGTVDLIQVSLMYDQDGVPVDDQPLEDLDEVVVYDLSSLLLPRTVSISGLVKTPGSYSFADGMTAEDLVLAAGGFEEGAQPFEAEVYRRVVGPEYTDTLTEMFRVVLSADLPSADSLIWEAGVARSSATLLASQLALRHGDRVVIRGNPGFSPSWQVSIEGEVAYPGVHVLRNRSVSLSRIVAEAGGLTPVAFPEGARLVRGADFVGIDFGNAMANPGGPEDIELRDGDRIIVPRFDPLVRVEGAVLFPSSVLYREGWGLSEYLGQAGGLLESSDGDRISVTYANGERAVRREFLGFIDRDPPISAGTTITVPARAPGDEGFDWDNFLSKTLSVFSVLATVTIAVTQISN